MALPLCLTPAVAVTAWLGTAPASAYVSLRGDVDPARPFGETQFAGTVFRLGRLAPGDFGVVVVNEGSRLTAGGIENGAKGDLVLLGSNSRITMDGTLASRRPMSAAAAAAAAR